MQCENCGAVLAKDDVFCGECGAPRPEGLEPVEPAAGQPLIESELPLPVAPVPGSSATPSDTPAKGSLDAADTRWRAATIVLVGLGILACLAGLTGFLLVGSIGGDTTTPQEDWLISALCCLLPIGGTGAILAAAGAAVWYTRLRGQ